MNTWPNRGAPPAAPAGGSKAENPKTQAVNFIVRPTSLTQANRPPRNPVRFSGFSKTLSPSLRVGYLATNRVQLLEALTQIKLVSTFVSSELNESFIHSLMADGLYARHVRRLRQRLLDRATAVVPRLTMMGFVLDPEYAYQGGTFLWVQHRTHPDALSLADSAATAGIYLAPGCAFRPDQDASSYFRFALPLCTGPSLDALATYLTS